MVCPARLDVVCSARVGCLNPKPQTSVVFGGGSTQPIQLGCMSDYCCPSCLVSLFCLSCSWVAAAFVPLCTRNRNDRLAGIASTIGMLVLVIAGIIIGVTGSQRRLSVV
jgi:hypothetical protein